MTLIFLLDRSDARGECLCAEARARLSAWSVDEVCDFINSIDICAEYATVSAHHFSEFKFRTHFDWLTDIIERSKCYLLIVKRNILIDIDTI